MSSAQSLILIVALLAANLPFVTARVFLFGPMPRVGSQKPLYWCVAELIVFYLLTGALAAYFESGSYGGVYRQDWQFFAVTACLFLVFAYPGFVARYLWHRRKE